jgi:hypothetical protein
MKLRLFLCALCLAALPLAVAGQTPSASPSESPSPSSPVSPKPPGTLQGEIDKAVDDAIDKGLLRFETNVEVEGTTPQQAFENLLKGFDLECGAPDRGAPTDAETRQQMRSVRPTTPYVVDFVPLLGTLQKKMAARGPGRYYIYEVKKPDGTVYRLRDTPMPMQQAYNTPGTDYRLMAEAKDLQAASEAIWRLERGLAAKGKGGDQSAPAPWLNWNCRPR